jgi:hypothetical protein
MAYGSEARLTPLPPGALPAAAPATAGPVLPRKPAPAKTFRPRARTKQTLEPDTGSPALSADTLWYKDAVFYELHVKAF